MKQKIFNDPVHGFISLPYDLLSHLVDHPFFQRLRRIKQLGLTDYVYPGALHTRFHHALGACHLTNKAISVLRSKGHAISSEEEEAALVAILLHDMGHGPYSHALEHTIISLHHEDITLLLMQHLNAQLKGRLDMAMAIFKNEYHKKFLHQLVSSQLDVDRLDYLSRDSFFTGVSEGVVNFERIIYMMNVVADKLVIEYKGIYSVENFLISRRHMYWQVYLHKTVLCAEEMMVSIMRKAKHLCANGRDLPASDNLNFFLKNELTASDFENNSAIVERYCSLDDIDVMSAVKSWQTVDDTVLSYYCKCMINRNLFAVRLAENEISTQELMDVRNRICSTMGLDEHAAEWLVLKGSTRNHAYNPYNMGIQILYKDGSLLDIATASDNLNIQMLSTEVVKYYIAYPKQVSLYKAG